MNTPIVEARGMGRTLQGDPPVMLVDGIDLAVAPGTFTAIVGPSGCGKSSLLYLLGLLDRPTEGELRLGGQEVSGLDGDARARLRLEKIGFVFQFHFLLPEFSALDNVMLPMRRLGRLEPAEIEARALALLGRMGLAGKERRTPDRLSGGERQRVAIARALANDPVLLLGDEPTGNLDSANSERTVELFRELAHEQDRALLCVTHDPEVAAQADIRVSMRDGRIVEIEA